MTVKELIKLLDQYVEAWPERADCPVYLSQDPEGNGYYKLDKGCLAHEYAEVTKDGYIDGLYCAKDVKDMEQEGSDTSHIVPVVIIFP